MKKILPIIMGALLLAFVIAVQLPIEIYLNNADEFTLPLHSLVYIWGGAFIIVFLTCCAPALIPHTRFREMYFAFLSTLALLIWFTAHFMFGSYGAFDGRGLTIDPYSIKAIIQAAVWILLPIGAIAFSRKIHRYLLQATVGLLSILIILTGYQVLNDSWGKQSNSLINTASAQSMPEGFVTFSSHQNIIHIVLDEQQSTVTEHLIQADPSFSQHLPGFIFFPNTSANYRSTAMAIPAMLTGYVYKNESDKNKFLHEVLTHNPFTQELHAAHYTSYIYTMGFYCKKANIENCIPHPELSPNKSAFLLLDYSLFKAAPDMLKPAIYNDDSWVIRRRFINPSYETTLGGLNHLAFEYFNDHFKVKDIPPTYKFYHSMITHSPAVLEQDCAMRITRISRHALSGKADQAMCAFSHIFDFLDNLKKAGIYDNTMIIISSDHGSNYVSKSQEENLKHNTVDERHYSTALATLFIKPFDSSGPMRISDAPVSLNDMPNTILSALNRPLVPDGTNALALSNESKKVREFIFYEYDNIYWEGNKLPPLTIYTIQGDVRDVRNWTLQCSDAGAISCVQ